MRFGAGGGGEGCRRGGGVAICELCNVFRNWKIFPETYLFKETVSQTGSNFHKQLFNNYVSLLVIEHVNDANDYNTVTKLKKFYALDD